MDFELTERQRALQAQAREFAAAEFDLEYALRCDRERVFPGEVYRKACQAGLIGVHFPREYGGGGFGVLEHVLVVEALCRQDPGLGVALSLRTFGSELLLKFASEEHRQAIIPGVVAGEVVTGAAFTEPEHGSDLTDVSTRAERDGDELVVDGVKTFITNGLEAHYITVLCKTDPLASPTYRGMSTILVETSRPGFAAEDLGPKMGQNMLRTTRLTLRGVRVPATNLVGQENRGFYQMLAFLDEARVAIAAQALGGAQAAYDRALAYVKQRRQFGRRLADFQATQHKVADMATKIEAARLLTYRAAWVCDHQGVDPLLTSMAKLYAPRVAVEVAEEAIQMLGGRGYFQQGEVERIYRDVRVMEIYEGSREIQKNTIASYLVGAPPKG